MHVMHHGSMNHTGQIEHDINNHYNSRVMFPNAASEVRKVDPDYVEEQHQTLFTDGYPFLLISQVSSLTVGKWSLNLLYKSSLFICHLLLSGIVGCSKQASRGTDTYESFQTQVLIFPCLLVCCCNYIIS